MVKFQPDYYCLQKQYIWLLLYELIVLSLLDSCDTTNTLLTNPNVVLLIRISVGILLKSLDQIGAPKLMNISYIHCLQLKKRDRRDAHTLNVRILPTPEVFDTGGSGSFLSELTLACIFMAPWDRISVEFRPRIWSSRLLRYVCTTCPLREGGGRCLQE